jgi:dTDP-4-amino-4,6-dideoxygalactose transaminase
VSSAVKVPFADLTRMTQAMRGDLDTAIRRVMDSGRFVLSGEGAAFEAEFAQAVGVRHAVGVGSGTDAIELALRALGVGPGDEVVTQANTCVPTVAAIERAGATPVLCDVDADTATIDPASLERALTSRTRAVVPVHLYGQVGDLEQVLAVCSEQGLQVVEDCAQAHGATLGGRAAGSMGAAGAFSFYPTKNLGALGDGGAVVTDDDALAERLRLLRQYGQTDRYHHVAHGVNSRLDEIQAAILRAKLTQLEAGNARRNEIASRYDAALEGTPVRPLKRLADRRHAFHLYVVVAPDRPAFQATLDEGGVGTLVHYPRPVHGNAPYSELGSVGIPLAVSEHLADRVVSLPLYPELTEAEVEHVVGVLGATRAILADG